LSGTDFREGHPLRLRAKLTCPWRGGCAAVGEGARSGNPIHALATNDFGNIDTPRHVLLSHRVDQGVEGYVTQF
jgi:hypothetical protein